MFVAEMCWGKILVIFRISQTAEHYTLLCEGCWAGSPPCGNGKGDTIRCTRQRQAESFRMDSSSSREVLPDCAQEHRHSSDISSSLQHLGFSEWGRHHQGTDCYTICINIVIFAIIIFSDRDSCAFVTDCAYVTVFVLWKVVNGPGSRFCGHLKTDFEHPTWVTNI